MSFNFQPDYTAFENNIIDVIKEEQIKLGYRSETISLYYPAQSIMSLLNTNTLTLSELQEVLGKFCSYVLPRLGTVSFTSKDSMFCLRIPPKGVDYVHDEVEERYFLKEFINTISKHNCSLEDILKIFHQYSANVTCEKADHGNFDYVIFFDSGEPDAYLYCIKFEGTHAMYHRFTKADYISFGFES